jgi:hypothetical protein
MRFISDGDSGKNISIGNLQHLLQGASRTQDCDPLFALARLATSRQLTQPVPIVLMSFERAGIRSSVGEPKS